MPKLGGINRKKIKDSSSSRGEAAAAAAAPKHKAKKKRSSGGGTGKQQLSAAQLYERAQQALAFERYDAALECLRDACELEPDAVEYVDAAGALLAELGRGDEAVQTLQRAVQLSPDEGFEKFMYLGQLLEGQDGLAATQRGVEVLQLTLNRAQEAASSKSSSSKSSNSREVAQLSKQLAAALCSLAEMMMGHADDVEVVSSDAESLLQRARAADVASPEPLQALASLRYEQGQPDEALVLLRQSMALWFKPAGGSSDEEEDEEQGMQEDAAAAAGQGDDDCEFVVPKKPVTMSEEGGGSDDDGSWVDEDEEEEDEGLPSYEFRFECAKMLLELDESTDAAVQVLEDLLAENDAVLDVWHLLGLAYYSGGALTEAREVCDAGLKLLAAQQVPADEEAEGGGIAAAFDDLSSAIAEAQAATGAEPDADGS